jgi:hypothetical protein
MVVAFEHEAALAKPGWKAAGQVIPRAGNPSVNAVRRSPLRYGGTYSLSSVVRQELGRSGTASAALESGNRLLRAQSFGTFGDCGGSLSGTGHPALLATIKQFDANGKHVRDADAHGSNDCEAWEMRSEQECCMSRALRPGESFSESAQGQKQGFPLPHRPWILNRRALGRLRRRQVFRVGVNASPCPSPCAPPSTSGR